MPATPNLALPYPTPGAPADVPADLQALAARLDVVAGGPIVTTLPGSPVDGQEVYYAHAGGLWHLRYRTAAPGASKWEFAGGAALHHYVAALVSTSSAAYTDLAGPTLTLPLAGEYEIEHAATIASSGAGISGYQSYAIGAAAAADSESVVQGNQQPLSTGNYYSLAGAVRRHTVAAGTVIACKYKSNGSSNFQYRSLRAVPVRLG